MEPARSGQAGPYLSTGRRPPLMPDSTTTQPIARGLKGVVFDTTESSFIDGEAGKLLYRGYNIHDLAGKSTFEEVAYLLVFSRLPHPPVAAHARIRRGQEPLSPRHDLSHAANFLYMLQDRQPDPQASRAIDMDFILHAEHGSNASAFAARVTASTMADLHAAIVSPVGTL